MRRYLEVHRILGEADVIASRIGDKAVRERMRFGIANSIGVIYTDTMMAIVAEHRDLDPDPKP
jgi:hypothetical protein